MFKDEKILIAACIELNPKAQRMLVDTYGPKLLSICRRYSASHVDPRDILQEAFIKIFKNLPKIDFRKGTASSYMIRICINVSFDKALKAKKRSEINETISEMDRISLNPKILSDMSAEYIVACISKLSYFLRTVFNLYVIDGYTHKEISVLLNITESTSRSYLSRARRKLQIRLEDYSSEKQRNGAI